MTKREREREGGRDHSYAHELLVLKVGGDECKGGRTWFHLVMSHNKPGTGEDIATEEARERITIKRNFTKLSESREGV